MTKITKLFAKESKIAQAMAQRSKIQEEEELDPEERAQRKSAAVVGAARKFFSQKSMKKLPI